MPPPVPLQTFTGGAACLGGAKRSATVTYVCGTVPPSGYELIDEPGQASWTTDMCTLTANVTTNRPQIWWVGGGWAVQRRASNGDGRLACTGR